jgi:glycerophosphoryl diester phosphodiesterase
MTGLPGAFLDRPIAHRALHDVARARPENSRAAAGVAIAHGYGIEIDVQLSADGHAMVFHDYDLARLTGKTGLVRDHSRAVLQEIALSGGAEGIPDLPAILDLVAARVPVLVELKNQDGAMGANIGALEEAVAQVVAGYAGPIALMSFNPHSVVRLAQLAPGVPRGLVTSGYDPADWDLSAQRCAELRDIPDYDRVGASFISHDVQDLARPRVAELREKGAHVLCWTVRGPQEEAQARKAADNITFEGYLP